MNKDQPALIVEDRKETLVVEPNSNALLAEFDYRVKENDFSSGRTSVSHPFCVDFLSNEILKLPGRLGMTLCPGVKQEYRWNRELQPDLERMKLLYKADVIVTLMEEFEFASYGVPDLLQKIKEIGFEGVHFPIVDGSIPEEGKDEEFLGLIKNIVQLLNNGKTVVVHCRGGLGRTGTVVSCVLVAMGYKAEEAIELVRKARSKRCVEYVEQEQYHPSSTKTTSASSQQKSSQYSSNTHHQLTIAKSPMNTDQPALIVEDHKETLIVEPNSNATSLPAEFDYRAKENDFSSGSRTSVTHPFCVDFLSNEILKLPGRLGMTLCPGVKVQHRWDRELEPDLERLKSFYKADVVVTLLQEFEFAFYGVPDLLQKIKESGFEGVHFPILDRSIPEEGKDEEFLGLVKNIVQLLNNGKTVVVHCRAGLGRTGTVAACVLIAMGYKAEEAIELVRKARNKRCVEFVEQEQYVGKFRYI